jgi:dUTP pyrophosphatase
MKIAKNETVMTKPLIKFVKIDPDAAIPQMETAGAAGADLRACIRDGDGLVRKEGVTLHPLQRVLFQTGLRLEIPKGFEVQIRPRSGLALKHGITVLNTPGTIDCDYRGPLGIILTLIADTAYTVHHLDRIAQMVVAPVSGFRSEEVAELGTTERASGGFGSTGK